MDVAAVTCAAEQLLFSAVCWGLTKKKKKRKKKQKLTVPICVLAHWKLLKRLIPGAIRLP